MGGIINKQEELNKLKQAAKLESYSSYSKFVRRTVIKEKDKVIKNATKKIFGVLYEKKT